MMADDSATPLAYSRHTVDVQGCRDVAGVAARLAAIGDVVAVNLVGGDGTSAAVCDLHIRTALAARPAVMIVETIPAATFVAILSHKLARTEREAQALRLRLRSDFVADLVQETGAVQHHVEQTLLLLDGFSLQRPAAPVKPGVVALVEARQSGLQALAAADNVLAMDALHYAMMPALRQLMNALP